LRVLRVLYIGDLNLKGGGAQRHTFYTINCIAKEFDVLMYIIGEPSPESLSLIEKNGINYIIVKKPSYRHLKKTCLTKNIKIIMLQWENPQWITMAYKLNKEIGTQYIVFLHEIPMIGTPVKAFTRNFLAEVLVRMLIQVTGYPKRIAEFLSFLYQIYLVYKGIYRASGVLAISPASAFYIQTYFPNLKNYLTLKIPNGVDITLIEDLLKSKSDFSYDISFMAARLDPKKGMLDLLEVVYRVNQKMMDELGRDVKVVVLGRFTDERTKLLFLRRSKELGVLKNIDILGYLPEKEKFKVLCSTRVFLYPSTKDCFSISLIEAMACGCPAVVYELPFAKQFRTDALFRVKYKNLDSMAAVTADIPMLSYKQEEKYLYLRRRAMNFARQFTWDKVCENEIQTLKYMLTKLK